jgi:hypothetical protein
MTHIMQRGGSAAAEVPAGPIRTESDPTIRTDAVYVVYTSIDATLAAVRVAGDFAQAMNVPVTLIHFRTVPYRLPADAPCGISPVETEAFTDRLRAEGLDVNVRVHLCRDERQAIPMALQPHSLVVVGGRGGWWPSESNRWRRMLEAAGHYVVFASGASVRLAQKERSHA